MSEKKIIRTGNAGPNFGVIYWPGRAEAIVKKPSGLSPIEQDTNDAINRGYVPKQEYEGVFERRAHRGITKDVPPIFLLNDAVDKYENTPAGKRKKFRSRVEEIMGAYKDQIKNNGDLSEMFGQIDLQREIYDIE